MSYHDVCDVVGWLAIGYGLGLAVGFSLYAVGLSLYAISRAIVRAVSKGRS